MRFRRRPEPARGGVLAAPLAERAIAVALSALLIYSATAHLGNWYQFLSAVYAYEIVNPTIGRGLAMVLPPLQLMLAACLLVRWCLREAYTLLALLFGLFAVAQASVLWRGLEIDCGCFGSTGSRPVSAWTLGTAVVAMAGSAAGRLPAREPAPTPEAARGGFTLVELLVVIGIVSLLIGLSLPAVQSARNAADRLACRHKMRQVVLALHLAHDADGRFPSGTRVGAPGRPYRYMSWLTQVLPYLDQEPLHRAARAAYAADPRFGRPPHHAVSGTAVAAFVCPADARAELPRVVQGRPAAYTSYLGVAGRDRLARDGALYADSAVRLLGVRDGTSNTIAVGERPPDGDGNLGWWYAGIGQAHDGSLDHTLGVSETNVYVYGKSCPRGPYSFREPDFDKPCDVFHFWSFHAGGANFAFADGSVRWLGYEALGVMPALATRAGGEVPSGEW